MSTLYDIILLRTTGTTIFAGCMGSDYCRTHNTQHELLSGFLSAIFHFSKEALSDAMIRNINYDDIQVNFGIDEDNGFILSYIHAGDEDASKIRGDIQLSMDLIRDKYLDKIDKYRKNYSLFEEFKADLVDIGIVCERLEDASKHMQLKEEHKTKLPLISRFLGGLLGR